MISKYIEQANFEDTGFSYTLSLISGKYKMVILYCLNLSRCALTPCAATSKRSRTRP